MIETLFEIMCLWVQYILTTLAAAAVIVAVACACSFVVWLFATGHPLLAILAMTGGITLVAAIAEAQ